MSVATMDANQFHIEEVNPATRQPDFFNTTNRRPATEDVIDDDETLEPEFFSTTDPVQIVSLFKKNSDVVMDLMLGQLRRFLKRSLREDRIGVSLEVVLDVAERMLKYCREHSNRIWPACSTIAREVGHGITQVKIAIAYLKTIFVAVLRRDELTLGPGPHRFPAELRRNEKKLLSACYDMSGAVKLLPLRVRHVLAEILRSAAGDSGVKTGLATVQTVAEPEEDPRFLSPFEEKKPFVPGPAPDLSHLISKNYNTSVQTLKTSDGSCNVENIEKSVGKQTSALPPSPSASAVTRRISDPIYKERVFAPKTLPPAGAKPPKTRRPPLEGKEKIADDAIGAICEMGGIQRRRIIGTMGAKYAMWLSWYGRWRAQVGDGDGVRIENMAGYLYKTWSDHYNKGRIVWEDGEKFRRWVARERRIAEETSQIHEEAVASRPASSTPPIVMGQQLLDSVTEPPLAIHIPGEVAPEPVPVPRRALKPLVFNPADLTDAESKRLLAAVFRFIDTDPSFNYRYMDGLRNRMKQMGWSNNRVRIEGERIWQREQEVSSGET